MMKRVRDGICGYEERLDEACVCCRGIAIELRHPGRFSRRACAFYAPSQKEECPLK